MDIKRNHVSPIESGFHDSGISNGAVASSGSRDLIPDPTASTRYFLDFLSGAQVKHPQFRVMVPKHSDAVAVHGQNSIVRGQRDVAHKQSGSQLMFDSS